MQSRKRYFCQNGWANRDGFWYTGFTCISPGMSAGFWLGGQCPLAAS